MKLLEYNTCFLKFFQKKSTYPMETEKSVVVHILK